MSSSRKQRVRSLVRPWHIGCGADVAFLEFRHGPVGNLAISTPSADQRHDDTAVSTKHSSYLSGPGLNRSCAVIPRVCSSCCKRGDIWPDITTSMGLCPPDSPASFCTSPEKAAAPEVQAA